MAGANKQPLFELQAASSDFGDLHAELEALLHRHQLEVHESVERWLQHRASVWPLPDGVVAAPHPCLLVDARCATPPPCPPELLPKPPADREPAMLSEPLEPVSPPGFVEDVGPPRPDVCDLHGDALGGIGEWGGGSPSRAPTSCEHDRSGNVSQGPVPGLSESTLSRMWSRRHGIIHMDVNDMISSRRRSEILAGQTAVQRLVGRKEFEWVMGGVVLVNVLMLGLQVQLRGTAAIDAAADGRPIRDSQSTAFDVFHLLFLSGFTLELLLRWTASGLFGFLVNRERLWNLFDIGVVTCSLFEFVFELATPSEDDNLLMTNAPTLRLMRVLRIVRVAKVIRVLRFFRELRLMIFAILRSVRLMCWALMVLGFLIFIFGVCLTNGTNDFLVTAEMWNDPANARLAAWFGTLDRAMLYLFMAMSGGWDWGEFYEVLGVLPKFYLFLFLAYVAFSLLAVVNVVTGIFVDSALQSNQADKDFVVQDEIAKQQQFGKKVKKVFEEISTGSGGRITVEEFENRLSDEHVVAYFQALKLDVGDAKKLFSLLDTDNSGEIDVDEFLTGCQRLQGESRALDMALMQLQIKWLSEALVSFRTSVDGSFASLCSRLPHAAG